MKVNILSDEKMRELGFTDRIADEWYYFKRLHEDISFNMTIEKSTGIFRFDILDEDFCQPFDYQHILRENNGHLYANVISGLVQKQIIRLVDAGVIEDYQLGDYI